MSAHAHHSRPPAPESDAVVVAGAGWTVTELVVAGVVCVTVFCTVCVTGGVVTVLGGVVTVLDGVVAVCVLVPVAVVTCAFAAAAAVPAFSETDPDPQALSPNRIAQHATDSADHIAGRSPPRGRGASPDRDELPGA